MFALTFHDYFDELIFLRLLCTYFCRHRFVGAEGGQNHEIGMGASKFHSFILC